MARWLRTLAALTRTRIGVPDTSEQVRPSLLFLIKSESSDSKLIIEQTPPTLKGMESHIPIYIPENGDLGGNLFIFYYIKPCPFTYCCPSLQQQTQLSEDQLTESEVRIVTLFKGVQAPDACKLAHPDQWSLDLLRTVGNKLVSVLFFFFNIF